MGTIDAKLINELRKITGAGIMNCKKALIETDGDKDKAIDYLRKLGVKIANKRSGCHVDEGVVSAAVDDDKHFGAIVELLCETDFVGKSDIIKTFIHDILTIAVQNKITDINVLKSFTTQNNITVDEAVTDIMGKVGEKLEIKYHHMHGEHIGFYNHFSNKLSVIACFQNCQNDDVMKNICMHIAAMNPLAIDRDGIEQDIIKKEQDIISQQITTAKNNTMIDKIAKGKLEKFFKENVLVEQAFIIDEKISVGDYLKKNNGTLITSFNRVEITK